MPKYRQTRRYVGHKSRFCLFAESCDHTIRSVDQVEKNGTFMSKNYPDNYDDQLRCIYKFVGRPHERVYVKFVHFDVKGVPPRYVQSIFLHWISSVWSRYSSGMNGGRSQGSWPGRRQKRRFSTVICNWRSKGGLDPNHLKSIQGSSGSEEGGHPWLGFLHAEDDDSLPSKYPICKFHTSNMRRILDSALIKPLQVFSHAVHADVLSSRCSAKSKSSVRFTCWKPFPDMNVMQISGCVFHADVRKTLMGVGFVNGYRRAFASWTRLLPKEKHMIRKVSRIRWRLWYCNSLIASPSLQFSSTYPILSHFMPLWSSIKHDPLC